MTTDLTEESATPASDPAPAPVTRGLPHPTIHRSARTDAGEWFDEATITRARSYSAPIKRWRFVDSVVGAVIVAVLIFTKAGPRLLHTWGIHNWVLGLVVINVLLTLLTSVQTLPISYWRTLVWDKKWALSTSTRGTWVGDQFKNFLQNVILTAALMIPLYAVIRATSLWWLFGGLILGGLALVFGFLYPIVLAPRFNTFTPLPDNDLKRSIDRIAAMSDVKIQGSFTMDASKRSTRDNAYVSGLGATTRVVMFDTILEHPRHVVEQVIAHELGHYRLRHLFTSVPEIAVLAVVMFAVTDAVLTWKGLLHAAGVNTLGDPGSFVLFSTVSGLAFVGFGVVQGWRSRSREREADLEALEVLRDPGALIDTWRRMTPKNLQDLEPSLFTRLKSSHPQPAERMAFARDWAALNNVELIDRAPAAVPAGT